MKRKNSPRRKPSKVPQSKPTVEAAGPETVGDCIDHLVPAKDQSDVMSWPPDAFAVCMRVLQRSGAYTFLVDDWAPHKSEVQRKAWEAEARALGSAWRQATVDKKPAPANIQARWEIVSRKRSVQVRDVYSDDELRRALTGIVSIADEACVGVGFTFSGPELWLGERVDTESLSRDPFHDESSLIVAPDEKLGSTLCKKVHPSRARVLPKVHTPSKGLTIRSLTHNLAYIEAPAIAVDWVSYPFKSQQHCLNLLLVPLPFKVVPKQFRATKEVDPLAESHTEFGTFTFDHLPAAGKKTTKSDDPTTQLVTQAVEQAIDVAGAVDAVVFPELAFTRKQHRKIVAALMKYSVAVIAGVGVAATEKVRGRNSVEVSFPSPSGPWSIEQQKHHRWRLDRAQIVQYGLSSSLYPAFSWWEDISIGPRRLQFVATRPWLTLGTLICEDLARQDPVADIVRAVGPSLVIAVLADGPQLENRWPSRYATVLAEDPGCSVLTLTSAGMSSLSRPLSGEDKSHVIALWKDAHFGTRQISLEKGASAVLLNVSVEYRNERTADGRNERARTGFPVLSGVHSIRLKNDQ